MAAAHRAAAGKDEVGKLKGNHERATSEAEKHAAEATRRYASDKDKPDILLSHRPGHEKRAIAEGATRMAAAASHRAEAKPSPLSHRMAALEHTHAATTHEEAGDSEKGSAHRRMAKRHFKASDEPRA
jgi:siderophore synthetase component